jgi:hypothetical protein
VRPGLAGCQVKVARFKRIGPPGTKRDGPIGDVIAVLSVSTTIAGCASYATGVGGRFLKAFWI